MLIIPFKVSFFGSYTLLHMSLADFFSGFQSFCDNSVK